MNRDARDPARPGPVGQGLRLSRDLQAALAAALSLVALAALGRWEALPQGVAIALRVARAPLGFACLLFVPGYCLTAALFPAKDDIDRLERAGLSLGLSVAWLAVLGLALGQLPKGISTWPILLGELSSTVLFAAVALWRRTRRAAGAGFATGPWQPKAWWLTLPVADKRIYGLCAAAILLASLALAWTFLVPAPNQRMTEFYVLGKEGLAEDYPRQAAAGEAVTVTVGIANREGVPARYRVEVRAAGEVLAENGPVDLDDGRVWEQELGYALPKPGKDQVIDVLLYRDGGSEPYRRLRLWMDVSGETP